MKFQIQRFIVWFLEAVCTHRWPLGCRPANLSADLDEKWRTGHWYGPEDPRFKPYEEDNDE